MSHSPRLSPATGSPSPSVKSAGSATGLPMSSGGPCQSMTTVRAVSPAKCRRTFCSTNAMTLALKARFLMQSIHVSGKFGGSSSAALKESSGTLRIRFCCVVFFALGTKL